MTLDATTLATPVGTLALLARDDVIVAAGFDSIDAMVARLPAAVLPRKVQLAGKRRAAWERLSAPPAQLSREALRHRRDLGRLSAAVAAYFDGDLDALDALPVAQSGGEFHQAAWKVMRDVRPGETISYRELAARAGAPAAIRAAGSACARNLIAPIVPCHRVLRTGGALGGYYYGLATKEWLLGHERRAFAG